MFFAGRNLTVHEMRCMVSTGFPDKPASWDRGLGLRLDSPEALAIIAADDASEAAMMQVVAGRLDAGLDVKAKLFSVASRVCLTTPCMVFDRIRSDQAPDWEWLQGLDPRQAAEARSIRAKLEMHQRELALIHWEASDD